MGGGLDPWFSLIYTPGNTHLVWLKFFHLTILINCESFYTPVVAGKTASSFFRCQMVYTRFWRQWASAWCCDELADSEGLCFSCHSSLVAFAVHIACTWHIMPIPQLSGWESQQLKEKIKRLKNQTAALLEDVPRWALNEQKYANVLLRKHAGAFLRYRNICDEASKRGEKNTSTF